MILDEFKCPFKDPRKFRTSTTNYISNEQLLYMLIDETELTFKKGIIVTASVTKVYDERVHCKLDNGLNATILKEHLVGKDTGEKLSDAI